jgi:hypothetical protein
MEICQYLKKIKENHKKEIKVVWERVTFLQNHVESMEKFVDEERWIDNKNKNMHNTSIDRFNSQKIKFH